MVAQLLLGWLLFFGDWPQFLGPHRDGVYGEAAPWPSDFAWQKYVGDGFAGPVISGGKLVLFHRRDNFEIVEAMEAKTGKPLWMFRYPTAYKDDFGFDPGPRATPTVSEGRVYTYGAEGVLHALDLETGKKLWRVDAGHWFNAPKGFFGAGGSPLVAHGKVYLNIGAKATGIAAFDAATGKLRWRGTTHGASYSSPVDSPFGIVFLTATGILVADPESGAVRYEQAWHSRSQVSVNAATPLVSGNVLFVSASYGTGAIALDFSTMPPAKLWSSDEVLSAHYATPVLTGGFLYGLHGRADHAGEQELRAVELATGRIAWSMKTYGAGTVTLLRDQIMMIRDDGQIFRIAPNPKELQVLGNFKTINGKVRAHPAVADGLVCLRNTKVLACLK
ncbi:MAG: PQQ-binding-like beta-propeller repeat protein [Bryobacteraceae bacterium]